MEINKKLQSALGAIATIILIVLAALPIYTNRKKTTSLEVKKINEVELTRPLNITRLSSIYMYDDSIPVKHLWQTYFVIKNTGETTANIDNSSVRIISLTYTIKKMTSTIPINSIIKRKGHRFAKKSTKSPISHTPDLLEVKDTLADFNIPEALIADNMLAISSLNILTTITHIFVDSCIHISANISRPKMVTAPFSVNN